MSLIRFPRDSAINYSAIHSGDAPTTVAQPKDSIGHHLLYSAFLLTIIALACGSGRLYSRAWLLRYVGWDDFCCLMAMACCIGLTTSTCLSVRYGTGQHILTVSPSDLVQEFKLSYISGIMYCASLGFTKASLLLQLIRLSPLPSKRLQKIILIILALTTSWAVAVIFSNIFNCTPPSYSWEQFDTTKEVFGSCINYRALQFSIPIVNVLTDVVVWLLPLRIIYKVQLPSQQKWGLFAVFALGGFVCISGIVRLIYITLQINQESFNDVSYNATYLWIWSNVEVCIAITCSSIPALRPLLKVLFPNTFGKFVRPSNKSGYNSHNNMRNTKQSHASTVSGVRLGTIDGKPIDDDSSSLEGIMIPGTAVHMFTTEVQGNRPRTEGDGEGGGCPLASALGAPGAIIKSTEVRVRVDRIAK